MEESRLKAAMRFAHLDDFYDDPAVCEEFETCMEEAEEYLAACGVRRTDINKRRYDGCVKRMATHWYDNRDAISAGTVAETPLGLRAIINQLKLAPSTVQQEDEA